MSRATPVTTLSDVGIYIQNSISYCMNFGNDLRVNYFHFVRSGHLVSVGGCGSLKTIIIVDFYIKPQ